jgi:tetratricopeptide (TPR) repeat protein
MNLKNSIIKILFFSVLLCGCVQGPAELERLAKQSEANYEKALAGYKELLAKDPKNVSLKLAMGRLYYRHCDYERAIETLKDVEDIEAKKLLAISFYKIGDYTQALAIFDALGKIEDDQYLYYYGLTCQKHNLYEQSLALFGRIKDKEYALKAKERIAAISGSSEGYLKDLDPALKEQIGGITQEKYPLAGAVLVLVDEKMTLTPENTIVSEARYVIKILNERGKQDFSEIVIGYDSTYEKVEIEYAKTIKPSGEVLIVGEKDIRDVSRYLNFPLYSNARARIISMPGITEGAVVDYRIKTTQGQLINKKDFDLAYRLQENEPIISASFTLHIPKNRNLKVKILNPQYTPKGFDLNPQISQTQQEKIYSWNFKNIPQIEAEAGMPPASEINSIILASTFNSWDEIYNWWWNLAKDRISSDKAITDKTSELIKGKKDEEEIIRAIYNYCAQKIRYVAVGYGQAGYQPHQAAEIFKNKYGDCKDKTILFITMLKVAGIDGYPVLIGTRGMAATSDDFPAVNFNHAIAAVELKGRRIFLDITAEVCSFGDLPEDNQERRVLIFKKDKYELADTPLLTADENNVASKTTITLNSDETIFGQREVLTVGQFDQLQRYWLRYTPPNLIEQGLKEKIQSLAMSGNLIKYNYENADDLNQPIRLTYEFSGKNFLSRGGPARILPQFAQLDTSIVAKDTRNYPLVLGQPSATESSSEIKLNDNLEVKYLANNVEVKSKWMDYYVSYEAKDRSVKVLQKQLLKVREVSKEEYPQFKKFLEDLAIQLDERIILERKNGWKKRKKQ